MQTKLHCVPSHVGVALAGTKHGEQLEPQLSVLPLLLHSLPQRWKPGLHEKSQRLFVQAGAALSMPSHDAHDGPQAEVLESGTHELPHRCVPGAQEHRAVRVSQLPGCGQSVSAPQPTRHWLPLQKKPTGHGVAVQSAGRFTHALPSQNCREPQSVPQVPQLRASVRRSTQLPEHSVSGAAQRSGPVEPPPVPPPVPPPPPPVPDDWQRPRLHVCPVKHVVQRLPPVPQAVGWKPG